MNYYFALLTVMLGIGFGLFSLYFIYTFYKKRKLQKILEKPMPKEYKQILKNIPFYNKLSEEEKSKIHKSILLFINMKEFVGIDIEVTNEMKVVIAFHACLLLLHVGFQSCYENLVTILVYSHTMVARQVSVNGGIFTKGDFLLEGQSAGDTVVISWNDAKKDAYHLHENNVLLHEFAHEIDFLDGSADGTPPLPYAKYHEWAKVISKEFNKLSDVALKNRDWGKYKLLGAYAATNEAEFFAVVTERYFEKPETLKKHFPELFEEFNSFYKVYL
ncbi:zinc-dependent peptidase [Sulfurimonas sediminis]|uniref:Zinc-dependent peptidase n=1 Tax=Sulfurimonas sediminis TaxID=2590020 RepID=A0A7M1B2J4_9BACT|nr:M90 family metallopeptidase [Sulfurimonas sediminis]QOP42928.1 zinc-dependent peptidase [Sulfurimonas sediminis]